MPVISSVVVVFGLTGGVTGGYVVCAYKQNDTNACTINPLKCSRIKRLHLKLFSAIQV